VTQSPARPEQRYEQVAEAANVSQERAEARAESMGSLDREVGQPRDSNPYAQLIPQSDLERTVISTLTVAWWRGWDQADAILQGDGLP
jgi:hypothetical protein